MPHLKAAVSLLVLAVSPCLAGEPHPPHFIPTITLDGKVNADSVDVVLAALDEATEAKLDAVVLVLNSGGGEVESGFRLVRALEDSKIPIVCVADKEAASMASYILEACPVRVMTKRSMIMFHEPAFSVDFSGQPTAWRSMTAWLEAESKAMAEHVCRRSKIKPEEMLERIRGGAMWWLNWQEAQKDGFVDLVVDSVADVRKSLHPSDDGAEE